VVAVIAVIAGILFPVFAQAREDARGAMCLNNMKQIGMAVLIYAQDYDDIILPVVRQTGKPKQLTSTDPFQRRADLFFWTQVLTPYLKSTQVLYCPSYNERIYAANASHPSCDGPLLPGSLPASYYYAHYGIADQGVYGGCVTGNPRVAPPGNRVNGLPLRRLSEVQRPTETAILQDNAIFQSPLAGFPVWISFGCECGIQGIGQSRHHQGCNYLFLDGHAKLMNLNPQREPLIPCPGAQIGKKSYPDCVCARYMTWDY
jgi:prepilin-type processing-associated H-X9-DG protein